MPESVVMPFEVCVDWDDNGNFTTAGDDISAYVHTISTQSGLLDNLLQSRIGQVGQCSLLLNNTDRVFTPLNTDSPYFGKMIPNRQIRIRISEDTTFYDVWRGYIWSFEPESGGNDAAGPIDGFTCTVLCKNEMAHIQDEGIVMPLQDDIRSDTLVRHVVNYALEAPNATRLIELDSNPANNDTLVLYDEDNTAYTFTFKTALSGDNQVLIGADLTATLTNLKDAINKGEGAGTRYSSNITMPRIITADPSYETKYSNNFIDSDVLLRHNVSTKDKLAQSFKVPITDTYLQATVYLKKFGSPTGTLTLSIQSSDGTNPTGTLVASGASGTVSESILSTGTYVPAFFNFSENIALVADVEYFLVLETDRAASGANYVAWGADGSSPSYPDGSMRSESGAVWSAESKDANFILGDNEITLTAVLPGSVGNSYRAANTGTWTTSLGGSLSVSVSGTDEEIGDVGGTAYLWAQQYTPPGTGTLSSLTVTLGPTVNSPFGDMYCYICPDSGGVPDFFSYLMQTQFSPVPSSPNDIFISSTVTGDPSTKYWIVLEVVNAQGTDDAYTWQGNNTDLYLSHESAFSTDGGSNWTADFAQDFEFSVIYTPDNFSGGVDYPAHNPPSLEAGANTFQYAADNWDSQNLNAMSALQQITDSEWGALLYIDKAGKIIYKNRHILFTQANDTPALTLSSEQVGMSASSSADQIYNKVSVTVTPLATLSTGVIAVAKSVVAAPGLTGLTERWNASQVIRDQPGTVVVKLPFVDPGTGERMGGLSVITPLEPTTDWTANEDPSGTSVDYTGSAVLSLSAAIVGSNVEITITNRALGPLFFTKLQVRGVGLVRYSPDTQLVEDVDSQTTYKLKRTHAITLPFTSTLDAFPRNLADYLLGKYKDPVYRIEKITFREYNKIGDVNLFSLGICDVLTISDYMTALTAEKYMITGIEHTEISQYTTGEITFTVHPLGDVTYWLLGVAGFGELGETTRLGL
jgi:hypothetical protein